MPKNLAQEFAAPFKYVAEVVGPKRQSNLRQTNLAWWQYERPRGELRNALAQVQRFVCTPGVAKHRIFVWRTHESLCNQGTLVFARADDYFFGVLHSRFHEVWALKLGTRLETRPRYTPTTCFETFPFPESGIGFQPMNSGHAQDARATAIATAAKELNELRENWLNPPEWTTTRFLEFPGAIDGPWSRFVVDPDAGGIGTVRYPRIEPRDHDCAKKLAKRKLTNLYNERPAWLANAHAKLDAAVAAAYGWSDLIEILERGKTGEIYDFKTGHYKIVDCDAKGIQEVLKRLEEQVNEQILERLLALNLERAAAEKKTAGAPKKRSSRARTAEEMI
jgi:hypothetical protein